MLKKQSVCFLLITILILLAGACLSKQTNKNEVVIDESSQDWSQLRLDGGYVIVNNVWNKGATTGAYKQKIFRKLVNDKPVFGWQWQWMSSSNVVAYPEVIYGDKPWDQPLGLVTQWPFKAGSKKIRVDFNINLHASGIFNMAFSLWGVSALPATKDTISHEIMIWNYNQGMVPSDQKTDSIEVNGYKFDVYLRENHGDASGVNSNNWTYIAFCTRTPILKGPLNVDTFIDYLLNKGLMSRNHYLTSIELGNEIIQGTGVTEISDYVITIE